MMQRAEISPLLKKNDNLSKNNYRPLSILTALSKILEGLICDQLSCYMNDIMSMHLSAYRKRYSCNNLLIKCIEEMRKSLDNGEYVGCLLIDLSNAFDSIPHSLLLAKLNAYGVSLSACSYVQSYLSNRKHRVKIAHTRGEWSVMKRGVPQGSLTGPLLFNIFINNYILSLDKICSVYNYADDNTLCCANRDPLLVKSTLECAAKCSLNWFKDNFMKANPAKFQAMLLGRDFKQMTINVEGNTIEMISSVKLLGIHIDNKLSFNEHISKLCKKSANQINVMKRLARHLDYDCMLKVYDCFFLSNFNYCPLAYNSQYMVNDNKIEKLNKRMLRVVCNDRISSYSDLLSRVNRPTMYVNRKKLLAEQVFKIIHDLSPPILPDF